MQYLQIRPSGRKLGMMPRIYDDFFSELIRSRINDSKQSAEMFFLRLLKCKFGHKIDIQYIMKWK